MGITSQAAGKPTFPFWIEIPSPSCFARKNDLEMHLFL